MSFTGKNEGEVQHLAKHACGKDISPCAQAHLSVHNLQMTVFCFCTACFYEIGVLIRRNSVTSTDMDKLKSSRLHAAAVTPSVSLCPPARPFPLILFILHLWVIKQKEVCSPFAIRGYQGLTHYLLAPRQGQTVVHPKTLQARNCFSDGTLASWSQHGTHSHNIWIGVFQQT